MLQGNIVRVNCSILQHMSVLAAKHQSTTAIERNELRPLVAIAAVPRGASTRYAQAVVSRRRRITYAIQAHGTSLRAGG
jgi:hypothetical protein